MNTRLVNEIHQTIKTAGDHNDPQPERRYHKHDEYLTYGLYTADFRKIMTGFQPQILLLPLDERLDVAAKLLSEHIGELGHAGIIILKLSVDELEPAHFPRLDNMVLDFRSWSHVDHFCGDVIKPLLSKYPKETLTLLEAWNESPNRFKRRASVVAFTRGVGASSEYTGEVLHLCDNLIWDSEDIVQKGVGWALKDNMRSSPDRIKSYVKDLRSKGVSSTITLYAIRDLKGEERQEILAIKKGSPVLHNQG